MTTELYPQNQNPNENLDPWADAVNWTPEDPWESTIGVSPESNETLAPPEKIEEAKRSIGQRMLDRFGIKIPGAKTAEVIPTQDPSSELSPSPWGEAVQPSFEDPWASVDLLPPDPTPIGANESFAGSIGSLEQATAEEDADYMNKLRAGGHYDSEGNFQAVETNYNRTLAELSRDNPDLRDVEIKNRFSGRLSEAKAADTQHLYQQEQQYAQRQNRRV